MVVGVMAGGVLLIVLFACLCSAFLLSQFDIRRRVLVGESGLSAILAVNLLGLMLSGLFALALAHLSGRGFYLHAAAVAGLAQAVLLVQHLRFYRRDALRVSYEN